MNKDTKAAIGTTLAASGIATAFLLVVRGESFTGKKSVKQTPLWQFLLPAGACFAGWKIMTSLEAEQTMAATEVTVDSVTQEPPSLYMNASTNVTAYFPEWRRAKREEVTEEMLQAARASLKEPIGSYLDKNGYRIALETHYNEKKGFHKGASIFLPKPSISA